MNRIACSVLLLLLFSLPAWAQTTSAPPSAGEGAAASPAPMANDASDATVVKPTDEERMAQGEALIAKALEAHGGDAFKGQVSQMSKGKGRLRPFGQAVTTDIKNLVVYKVFQGPSQSGKDRIEMTLPQGEVVQVFNGKDGWVVNNGHFMDQTARLQNRRYFGYDVLRRFDADFKVRQLDNETAVDRELEVVRLNDGDGHITKFYLDPETHRIFQVKYKLDDQELTERYTDYEEHGGVLVPTKVELYQGLAKVLEFEVDEVTVNGDLEASLFDKPALP